MDLSLWEASDVESIYRVGNFGDNNFYSPGQSGYDIGDHWMCDFSFGYGRDVIEEDSLNERSCLQVLKILLDKADEDIVELEEDITMLQCQLAWGDEDWSKPCSAALREKIDHLDILMQSLKKEITQDVHYLAFQIEQPEKLARRLQDFVKPLLENYLLVKSKQTLADGLGTTKLESSTLEHDERVEQKGCINLLKENERQNPFVELGERKLNHPQQKQDAIISKFTANSHHTCATGKSGKGINKLNGLKGKRMPYSAPVRSRKRSSIKPEPADEVLEMGCEKETTEAFIKTRKARAYHSRAVDKNVVPTKTMVKIERKTIKCASREDMKLENKIHLQQRHEIEAFKINRAKPIVSSLKPEGERPHKKCKADPKIVQSICPAKEMDIESSSVENLSKNGNNETQKKKMSSFCSQNIGEKKTKSSEMGCDPSNIIAEKLLCIKDVEGLTINDLKIIARNQKLPGYSKLRKRELQERLGLEEPLSLQQKGYETKRVSPANTI